MKKILVIITDSDQSLHALRLAIRLAKQVKAKLNAIFINGEEGQTTKHSTALASGLPLFEHNCREAGIAHHVKHVRRHSTDEILDETAFADLLICDDNIHSTDYSVQSLVSSSHCPVLMVNSDESAFSDVILSYDGNTSSINAIKQYTYLFSWYSSQHIYLVSVIPANIVQMEYDGRVREWLLLHFPHAEVVVLKGDAKTELCNFIKNKPGSLVVMGAFGRSALSRFFKESVATTVLSATNSSIFISHS